MENVVLTVHLLLALGLIGVVLLQRSEGGGLGLGGGGGGGGIMSGRSAASALSKVTWILAVAFIITSLGLTVLAARNSAGSSVVDSIGIPVTAEENLLAPLGDSESLLPPTENSDSPLVPSAD
jgi:preprotein translocase subunit SecG